ncbi:MAG: OsmC family protein [Thermoplasmata archaeon]|nr:OsmC family protein [Thermoplasmata archaeon]
MKAVGTWQEGYRTVLEDSTGHRVTVDLPHDEGGGNAGPFALELSLLSLAGCITTIFALVAKKRRLKFEGMSVELDAQRPKGAPTIASVAGVLRVTTTAPWEEVEPTFDITLRTCRVGVLYEKAHIPVRVRLEVLAPRIPVEALPH